jgi:outer membrane autotransporter protein
VLAAGGRATLTGASVIVTGVSGFTGKFGSYPILTAAGGLNGQFGQIAGGWDQVIAGALLQPFGGLAYVHVSDSPLVETGGAAALHVGTSSIDDTYTSLGVRGATPVKIGDLDLTVNGLAGWQHAFGVLAPQTSAVLAGAPPFPVQGVPIARHGWIAGRAQQNQANGALTDKF